MYFELFRVNDDKLEQNLYKLVVVAQNYRGRSVHRIA